MVVEISTLPWRPTPRCGRKVKEPKAIERTITPGGMFARTTYFRRISRAVDALDKLARITAAQVCMMTQPPP